jgi:hypothetical protein
MRKTWLVPGLLCVALLLRPGSARAQGVDNVFDGAAKTSQAEMGIETDLMNAVFFGQQGLMGLQGIQAGQDAGLAIGLAFAFYSFGFNATTRGAGVNDPQFAGIVEDYALAKILAELAVNVYLPAAKAATSDTTAQGNINLASGFLQLAIQEYATINDLVTANIGSPFSSSNPIFPLP